MGFLPGWSNRKKITLTGSTAGTLTNYQVRMLIYKSFASVDGTGGVITHSGGYTIHTFNNNDTFTPAEDTEIEYLIIAGGGGGGTTNAGNAGGGGAGGCIISVAGEQESSFPMKVTKNTAYQVVVGNGGSSAANGNDSTFNNIIAKGGGAGGYYNNINAKSGGSGGGGGQYSGAAGAGISSQGNNGGSTTSSGYGGGGGGGASLVGNNAYGSNGREGGYGGNGKTSSITGLPITRAGGGAGSSHGSATNGVPQGGSGGGGNGHYGALAATNGTPNTGGGGGGGGENIATGTGGSGVVIIRYLTQQPTEPECKNDFSDISFTDSDGITPLSYWIESFVSGISAVVWVKIPNIPISPGTSTIYIYYNNPSAVTTSNGGNTFIYFNDFSSSINFDQFPYGVSSNIGTTPEDWTLFNNTLKHLQSVNSTHDAAIKNITLTNCSIRMKWNLDVLQDTEEIGINFRWASQANRNLLRYLYSPSSSRIVYVLTEELSGVENNRGTSNFTPIVSTWYEMEIMVVGSLIICYHNGIPIISAIDTTLVSGYFGVHGASSINALNYANDYIVRNYILPEPSVTSFGVKETSTVALTLLGNLYTTIQKGISMPTGAACGRRRLRNR